MPPAKQIKVKPLAEPIVSPAVPSRLFVGTSGWAYPTWKPGFYPREVPTRKLLSFYASQLNSVEVNYTFRTLPTRPMLEDWLAQTGDGFRFSFKAPQRITHFSRLKECEEQVGALLEALFPVADAGKLGPILFQLPPNFKADLSRLGSFLSIPSLRLPAVPPIAFEFRHASWFTEEAYVLLRAHNAALCIAENEDLQTPEIHCAERHTCFRLRRSGGYTAEEIAGLATRIERLATDRDVYVYFKHEDEPTGALNAAAFARESLRALAQASEQDPTACR